MTKKKTAKKSISQKNSEFSLDSLRESLKNKTKAELLDMIISLASDHDSVYKAFEQEAEVKAAQVLDTPENLFKKAKKLIDKGTKIDRNDPYWKKEGFGGPSLHLEPLNEVVKLLAKNKTPETFGILQKITEYLLEKSESYFGETGAETAFDYEIAFETIADAVIACKEKDAGKVLTWVDEMDRRDESDITGEFCPAIKKAYRKKDKTEKKK